MSWCARDVRRLPTTAAEWFVACHREDADPALKEALEAWLAGDVERQRQYALCEIAWELSHVAAARVRDEMPVEPIGRAAGRRWMLGMGLAAVVLIAAIGLWLEASLEPGSLRYATGPGEQRTVVLRDGSRITLNTRTTIEVTARRGRTDVAFESGEAFFEVAPDPSRDFRVITSLGRVRVVGTRFAIHRHARLLEVTTEEGLVQVTPTGPRESISRVLVRAGESAIVSAEDLTPRIRRADLRRIDNWRHRRLEFDSVPLAELLEEFSRYTTVPLRAADAELGAQPVSGVFKIGDVAALSDALRAAFGLEVRDSGAGELIVERASSSERGRRAREPHPAR